jgi:hypothetical protein
MEVLVAILMIGGVIIAISRSRESGRTLLATSRAAGRLGHLRSGEYPSSCSWCKNLALARKLIMFERSSSGWRASDLFARLQGCAEVEVEMLASAITTDRPTWRRICSERCAKEFFAAENVAMRDAFINCDYCSTRSPAALMRCPNCGAAHRSS